MTFLRCEVCGHCYVDMQGLSAVWWCSGVKQDARSGPCAGRMLKIPDQLAAEAAYLLGGRAALETLCST